jgi:hypothetical protein
MVRLSSINRPFTSVSGNNVETGLLTLHALVTTLMTTLPFPLTSRDAAGMSVLVFVPAGAFLIYMVSKRAHVLTSRITAKFGGGGVSSPTGAAGGAATSPNNVTSPSTGAATQDSSSTVPVPFVGGTITPHDNAEDGAASITSRSNNDNDNGGVELQQILTETSSTMSVGDTKTNSAMIRRPSTSMSLPPSNALDSAGDSA